MDPVSTAKNAVNSLLPEIHIGRMHFISPMIRPGRVKSMAERMESITKALHTGMKENRLRHTGTEQERHLISGAGGPIGPTVRFLLLKQDRLKQGFWQGIG